MLSIDLFGLVAHFLMGFDCNYYFFWINFKTANMFSNDWRMIGVPSRTQPKIRRGYQNQTKSFLMKMTHHDIPVDAWMRRSGFRNYFPLLALTSSSSDESGENYHRIVR
jgi:hypothetical protein